MEQMVAFLGIDFVPAALHPQQEPSFGGDEKNRMNCHSMEGIDRGNKKDLRESRL